MVWLWVVAYPHGTRRIRESKDGKKRRLRLPNVPQLVARGCNLKSNCAKPFLSSLVEVEMGLEYSNILTPWPEEGRILHNYFLDAADAYMLNVQRVLPVVDDVPLNFLQLKDKRVEATLKHPLAPFSDNLSDVRLLDPEELQPDDARVIYTTAGAVLGDECQA